ncbi:MAG: hypothetical protein KGJ13_09515 [Patescibacteria group bacterium]|nr:hypothetical protein [Patescibacteria group bacterium]
MTANPNFLKILKTHVKGKIRGIRDSLPSGYVVGRLSASPGPAELISLDSLQKAVSAIGTGIATLLSALDTIGATQGSLLYRSATAWTVLTPGTSGQVLGTFGTGANPAWTTAGIGANPTATAGDLAINGTATSFMRSDAAPAVQKASAAQFGIVKADGTTITVGGGVISAAAPWTNYVPTVSANAIAWIGI